MRTVVVGMILSLIAPLALGQTKAIAPQLLAGENEKDRKPLRLAQADVRVVITAGIAETTMTLRFANDTPRQLEGELVFPLPENATVSGFGLDVNGTLVDGVPVERQKARVTYEKETRKRVDPGLVEQTVGNNYRTRIYPIPPNGSRTIKLQYVSDVVDEAGVPSVRLPLNWGQDVDQATIRIEVAQGEKAPALNEAPAGLAFAPFENRFVAEKSFKSLTMNRDLVVALPADAGKQQVVVEKRLKAATMEQLLAGEAGRVARNEFYFVIKDTAPAVVERRLSEAPARIGILWDASLSRAETDKARELFVLGKILATLPEYAMVDIVVFRNEPEAPVSFPVKGGVDPIIEHLKKVTYDGGTNLSLLPVVKNYLNVPGNQGSDRRPMDYAYWLLFSDGIADLGPETPARLEAKVFTVANDAKANHALLRRLATRTGGEYLNFQRASDDDVVAAVRSDPFMLLGVEAKDAGSIAEVYPNGGAQSIRGGRVVVTGRLMTPQAVVTLKYGHAGVVTHKVDVTLKQDGAATSGLVSRFWAQQKIAELSGDVEANNEALAAVGKEFNLVTPNTSLLVLETVDQYLEHKIVPPKTAAKLYEDFMQRIEQQKVQVGQSKEERIKQVLAMWDERVKWWEAEHKYPEGFAYKQDDPRKPLAVSLATDASSATAVPAPQVNNPRPAQGLEREVRAREESRRDDALEQARFFGSARGSGAARPEGAMRKALKDDRDADNDVTFNISIKEWDPNVPYLKAMRESGGDGAAAYAIYLKQRPAYIASPAFYLDCAEYLFRNGQKALAIRVLTNVAELKLESAQLLRIVAHKLNQVGDRELAIQLFEQILKMRPEEPQSHRDLALAISDRADAMLGSGELAGNAPLASRDYFRALELLNHVIMTHWDRFDGIELPALMEANRIIAKLGALPSDKSMPITLDPRLVKNLDLDVRIVLTWDADLTDVDLWVVEPTGEKCVYDHNRTTIGGLLSRDFTQGYGPEEYCLRKAMAGKYKIQANYYGSTQTGLVGPCTVQATVITNFGRPSEKRQTMTLRLDNKKDVVDVGEITLGK